MKRTVLPAFILIMLALCLACSPSRAYAVSSSPFYGMESVKLLHPEAVLAPDSFHKSGGRFLALYKSRDGPGYALPGGLRVYVAPSLSSFNGSHLYLGPDIAVTSYSVSCQSCELPSHLSLLRAQTAWSRGFNGSGVVVAVVDTGVDFGNPDLFGSMARDRSGFPLMLDADGQGIVLANSTVKLNIENGVLESTGTHGIGLVKNATGVYLNFTSGFNVTVYNPLYPFFGPLVFKARIYGVWRIGASTSKFIPSASGEYHMAVLAEALILERNRTTVGVLLLVPAILTDPRKPGVYDTVYADLSDIYKALVEFLNGTRTGYDQDFYDEKPAVLGRDERLIYDKDGDGFPELSLGAIGAYVLDVWGLLSNKTRIPYLGELKVGGLLPPLSENGSYFTVMYDFFGHGTPVASLISGLGTKGYDVYGNGSSVKLVGVAPGSKIMAVKALWLGDVPYAWLWSAGFEYSHDKWVYTGVHRAQIIVNSWGVSQWPVLGSIPGLDPFSLLASSLSIPGSISRLYPGSLFVVAAGNGGPGSGTVTAPAASPYVLAAGASTDMSWVSSTSRDVWRGYRPARAGGNSSYHDTVAYWSARGPTLFGWPKPDILAPGMFGFASYRVLPEASGSTRVYGLFGGTSMAAPLVGGAAAIAVQALSSRGLSESKSIELARVLLVNSAKDLGLPLSAQGSGRLDLARLLDSIEDNVWAAVPSNETGVDKMLASAAGFWGIDGRWDKPVLLPAARLSPDSSSRVIASLSGATAKILEAREIKTFAKRYSSRTMLGLRDPLLGKKGGAVPRYLKQKILGIRVPKNFDWASIELAINMSDFLGGGETYLGNVSWVSLYVYDWNDSNNDGVVWYNETKLIAYSARVSNYQEVLLPAATLPREGLLLGVYQRDKRVSYWSAKDVANATRTKFTLAISFYKWLDSDLAIVSNKLEVRPNWSAMPPGCTMVKLVVELLSHKIVVPLSLCKPVAVPPQGQVYYNVSSKASMDISWRYETGSWKSLPLKLPGGYPGLVVRACWGSPLSFASLTLVNSSGVIVASSVDSGALGELYGWPSVDWVGPGLLGSGGYMNPRNYTEIRVAGASSKKTWLVMHVPIMDAPLAGKGMLVSIKSNYMLLDIKPPLLEIKGVRKLVGREVVDAVVNVSDGSPITGAVMVDGETLLKLNESGLYSLKLSPTYLGEGRHTVTVIASDAAGNKAAKSVSFVVDLTPPLIACPSSLGLVSGILNVSCEISDAHSYRVSLAEPARLIGNRLIIDTRLLGDGVHELSLSAVDSAGNKAVKTIRLVVDNTPPKIIIEPLGPTVNVTSTLRIRVEVHDDNLRSYTILVDGAPRNTTIIRAADLPDGAHLLEVRAVDKAGNTASKLLVFSTAYYASLLAERASESWRDGLVKGSLLGFSIALLAAIIIIRMARWRAAENKVNMGV